jgi:hypothetical protein
VTAALFWIGVILAVDALVGLVGLARWRRSLPNVPIGRIAAVEAVVAAACLLGYLWLTRGGT